MSRDDIKKEVQSLLREIQEMGIDSEPNDTRSCTVLSINGRNRERTARNGILSTKKDVSGVKSLEVDQMGADNSSGSLDNTGLR